jgi:decaprenylphospho-beta-D-ribofuranose 2-oxidase
MILSGWGRYPAMDCETRSLRDPKEIASVLERSPSLIARGNGRAYGDAALNSKMTLLIGGCDRFREFDTTTGLIECEGGTLLSDILRVVVPRGWFPPVVPGTKYVTVGGLIAADVHGKNHHRDGSFGRFVESISLAMADGSIVDCSRSENSEVFAATIGGMGLTGIILSAKIRLRPVASGMIDETIIRAPSLQVLLDLFKEHDASTYSVAWIDCLAGGGQFGRGVLMLGEHAKATNSDGIAKETASSKRLGSGISVPIVLPISPLNKWTIKMFNEAYYHLQKPRKRRTPYNGFFFPLDAIHNWNRIYGRRGFVQYQCVIGGVGYGHALRELIKVARDMGVGSFLAVLKKLGSGNRYMSFPTDGYTITLDFPVCSATMTGLKRLDAIVAEHKGRIYLAKDARAPRELVEQGYPEIEAFRNLRRSIDPERKFRSALSERLDI